MADFEERADQLTLDAISSSLADGEIFRKARRKLLGPGAKLLVGPRGTGKTHLMRFAYAHALTTQTEPIAIYANFSRYLHLEPLLKRSPDALKRFHAWVLAKILVAVYDSLNDASFSVGTRNEQLPSPVTGIDEDSLRSLVGQLEQGGGDILYQELGSKITVDFVLESVDRLRKSFGRMRAVLLLDDAALTLADQYLIGFFDVFRLLKTPQISPKASVYPGSTQYGPTFHVSHETEEVHLWLSVEDAKYSDIMGSISDLRFDDAELARIDEDALEMLKYMSFGVPRHYLRMLRELLDDNSKTLQQSINRIVQEQTSLLGKEYDSLGIKLQQFASLVAVGREFFDASVKQISAAQTEEASNRNIVLGLRQGAARSPLSDRMVKFLVEVGLLYPLQAVSHGPDRKYDRFIPHLAFLRQSGAFRAKSRGLSLREELAVLGRPAAKHPVRRELTTLLDRSAIENLRLNLPPCKSCGTARINESQRYCHACGKELVQASLFETCMSFPLERVPGISTKIMARLKSGTNFRTIGDVYTSQSASKDLQTAKFVGPKRALTVVDSVENKISEFLS